MEDAFDFSPVVPEYCRKPILVLGCGNILFGDDGFGPAVAEYLLAHCVLRDTMCILDVGTGVRNVLFTICLSGIRPSTIIIVDAVDVGAEAGRLFELPIEDVPLQKQDDFSFHCSPTSNLAKELLNAGIDVRVFVCQTALLPESVRPGLSEPVRLAVPIMSRGIQQYCLQPAKGIPLRSTESSPNVRAASGIQGASLLPT